MKYLEYEIPKGWAKKFNEMNQIIKNVFTTYVLLPLSNTIIDGTTGTANSINYVEGFHLFEEIGLTLCMQIDTREAYKALVKGKQYITKILIGEDFRVYFQKENPKEGISHIPIGLSFRGIPTFIKEKAEKLNQINSHMATKEISLDEKIYFDLLKGKLIVLQDGDKKLFFDKKLFPGFKEGYTIRFSTSDKFKTGTDEIFFARVTINRNGVETHHAMKAIVV